MIKRTTEIDIHGQAYPLWKDALDEILESATFDAGLKGTFRGELTDGPSVAAFNAVSRELALASQDPDPDTWDEAIRTLADCYLNLLDRYDETLAIMEALEKSVSRQSGSGIVSDLYGRIRDLEDTPEIDKNKTLPASVAEIIGNIPLRCGKEYGRMMAEPIQVRMGEEEVLEEVLSSVPSVRACKVALEAAGTEPGAVQLVLPANVMADLPVDGSGIQLAQSIEQIIAGLTERYARGNAQLLVFMETLAKLDGREAPRQFVSRMPDFSHIKAQCGFLGETDWYRLFQWADPQDLVDERAELVRAVTEILKPR